jgi:hypothetical protein
MTGSTGPLSYAYVARHSRLPTPLIWLFIGITRALLSQRGRHALVKTEMQRSAVSVLIFLGQALLGVPFVVFAYWYERQEVLYRDDRAPWNHTMFGHAVFGLFFQRELCDFRLVVLSDDNGDNNLGGRHIYIYTRAWQPGIPESQVPITKGMIVLRYYRRKSVINPFKTASCPPRCCQYPSPAMAMPFLA